MRDIGVIYKIVFPNGKEYIGQTIRSVKERLRSHINDSYNIKYKTYNTKVARAIRKYCGVEKDISELKLVTIKQDVPILLLDKYEIKYIKKYNSIECGYNIAKGGKGIRGYKHTKKAKEKISKRAKLQVGENATNNKANWQDVNKIRKMYLSGTKVCKINDEFGYIHYNTIQDIIKNRTWSNKEYKNKIQNIKKMNMGVARKIRKDYNSGKFTLKRLSKKYFLSIGQVHNIVSNKSWRDKRNKNISKNKVATKNIKSASKLNKEIVNIIRRKHNSGKYTCFGLATNYGVSSATISNIVNYKTWK